MAFGQIIRTIATGITTPSGLEFDGKYLWTTSDDDHTVYQMDRDGKVIHSFDPGLTLMAGLTTDGKNLIISALGGTKIYIVDKLGKPVQTLISDVVSQCDLCFDGVHLYTTVYDTDKIRMYDMVGNLVRELTGQDTNRSITTDGKYLYVGELKAGAKIYQMDRDGRVINSFSAPTNSLAGLATDGRILYSIEAGVGNLYMHEI